MSWDIFISRTPVNQLEDAIFESLGSKLEVINKLKEILPSANFDASNWGNYRDDECSIEFHLNESDEIKTLMLYVRGGGDRPILIIKEICEKFNCFAMDGTSGEQMDFDNSDQKSFKEWQDYRDKVLKNT